MLPELVNVVQAIPLTQSNHNLYVQHTPFKRMVLIVQHHPSHPSIEAIQVSLAVHMTVLH